MENFRVADFSMNSTSRSIIVTVVKVVVVVAAVVVVVMLKTVVVCVWWWCYTEKFDWQMSSFDLITHRLHV